MLETLQMFPIYHKTLRDLWEFPGGVVATGAAGDVGSIPGLGQSLG